MSNKATIYTVAIFSWIAGFGTAFLFISGHVGDTHMTKELLERYGFMMVGLGVLFVLLMRFTPRKNEVQ